MSIFGRVISLVLIARRSRHFAGTRYLKWGVNDRGRVANEVEVEQLLLCTALHLHRYDPMYTAARLHFENLMERYGRPVIILNLIKVQCGTVQYGTVPAAVLTLWSSTSAPSTSSILNFIKTVEKHPREMILRREFAMAVAYLNRVLPPDSSLTYIHWDFSRYAKRECLAKTGFFYSGQLARAATKTCFSSRPATLPSTATTAAAAPSTTGPKEEEGVKSRGGSKGRGSSSSAAAVEEEEAGRWVRPPQLQHGIVRTNCLDCLDRTNVAQFVIGREALAQQLYSLGITDSPHLDSKSDMGRRLQGMYIAMGDALALQYGGSAAHNLVIAERPGTWRSTLHSQEVLKSLHRYYSNAITDADKQDAINLFLGHFQPWAGQAAIWELGSDQHLHGATGRGAQVGEVGVEQGQLSGGRGVEGGGMMGAAAMPSASFSPSLASLPDVSDAPSPPMDLSLLPSHVGSGNQGGSLGQEGGDRGVQDWRGVRSGVRDGGEVGGGGKGLGRGRGGEVVNPTEWAGELKECGYVFLHELSPDTPHSSAAAGVSTGPCAADAKAAYPALRRDGGEASALHLAHACMDGSSWHFYQSYLTSVPSLIPGNTLSSEGDKGAHAHRQAGPQGAWPLELQGFGALNSLENTRGGGREGPRLDEMLGGWAVAEAAVEDARRAEEAEEVVRREAELLGGDYGVSVPHVLPAVVCAGLMDGWVAQSQADMRAPFQLLPY
ncbi:unnamed protein product [Closterium sp. Yama58-4]|nr:unnamed protein product [Closterium sp. Yama58-4]